MKTKETKMENILYWLLSIYGIASIVYMSYEIGRDAGYDQAQQEKDATEEFKRLYPATIFHRKDWDIPMTAYEQVSELERHYNPDYRD